MSSIKIIGLSGTSGSGKDTLANLLTTDHNYLYISGTDTLRQEAKTRGLLADRKALRTISTQWRHEHGMAVLIDKAVEVYEQFSETNKYSGLVFASVRNPGEAERIKELGGKLVWLDGDTRVRFERNQAHRAERGRPSEDNQSFEQFLADEQLEMYGSGDKFGLNMNAVKQLADVTIFNNGSDFEAFKCQADDQLKAEHIL